MNVFEEDEEENKSMKVFWIAIASIAFFEILGMWTAIKWIINQFI